MYVTARANGVVVWWEAIPAHQERGCVTGYHVYLRGKDGQGEPAVYGGYGVETSVLQDRGEGRAFKELEVAKESRAASLP